MRVDPWLRLPEKEIRRKLTYDPSLRNVKITKGSILDDKNKNKLYRFEAINEISKELSKHSHEEGKIKALRNKFGMTSGKAVQVLDVLKDKKMDKWEVLKNYKRVRKDVDGYISPTIEKDIINNIETGRKNIKQIIKDAKRAQVIYHRRVLSGFTNYAEEMQEGRFSNKVDRVASALERTLTTDDGQGRSKISSASVLGVKTAKSATSALGSKGGKASAVDTEAQALTRSGPETQKKNFKGVPGSVTGPIGSKPSTGGVRVPLGH